jgi:hypothetical protein
MAEMTLEQYKSQERQMAVREAQRGFRIHALVTAVVLVGLVALNVFVASEFPWAIFPALGMSIGLWFHWYFGVRRGDQFLVQRQHDIEVEATRRAA